jgi:hypothetical protein
MIDPSARKGDSGATTLLFYLLIEISRSRDETIRPGGDTRQPAHRGAADQGDALRSAHLIVTRCLVLTTPSGKIVVGLAAVVALAVLGTVALANGVPVWGLAACTFGGAVAGIRGGRFVLRMLPSAPVSDSTASIIDLGSDDDRVG